MTNVNVGIVKCMSGNISFWMHYEGRVEPVDCRGALQMSALLLTKPGNTVHYDGGKE